MKVYTQLITTGLILVLLLGSLSACGEHGAENTTLPEVTQNVTVKPSLTPEPTAEPTPDPSPTPSDPPYDVFSDHNVLWGENELITGFNGYYAPGEVRITPLLETTMASATEENLIAFVLFPLGGNYALPNDVGIHAIDMAPIQVEDLNIPEILNPDNVLYELIASVDAHNGPAPVSGYIYAFSKEYMTPLKKELDQKVRAVLESEYGMEPWETMQSEVYLNNVDAVVSELLKSDTYFLELYNQYNLYFDAVGDFWFSWVTNQTIWIREELTAMGFIPVYSTEEAFAAAQAGMQWSAYPTKDWVNPIYSFNELAFVFVGTAQQIEDLRDHIQEQALDRYFFKSAGKMGENQKQ